MYVAATRNKYLSRILLPRAAWHSFHAHSETPTKLYKLYVMFIHNHCRNNILIIKAEKEKFS
jgi:hypothetical protein